jgi:hypothetical protein
MKPVELYQSFSEACLDHRNPQDPEVQLVIHLVQEDMEMVILEQQGRMVAW